MAPENRAILSLESGEHFFGYGFGPSHDSAGELVFNTSMTGYQEIATDASYRGQIVTLTYPLINNYGANPIDVESRRAWIAALVVRPQRKHLARERVGLHRRRKPIHKIKGTNVEWIGRCHEFCEHRQKKQDDYHSKRNDRDRRSFEIMEKVALLKTA